AGKYHDGPVPTKIDRRTGDREFRCRVLAKNDPRVSADDGAQESREFRSLGVVDPAIGVETREPFRQAIQGPLMRDIVTSKDPFAHQLGLRRTNRSVREKAFREAEKL